MPKHTAKTIRQKFLNDVADFVDDYVLVAKGEGIIPCPDEFAQREVWDTAKKLILQAGDLQKLQVQSGADVLKLIAQGRITVDEAERLMGILHVKTETEELPRLLDAMEEWDDA